MIIDWYTVIFQIINFLILVFLLRRFLYKPIIKSMDVRKEKLLQKEEKASVMKEEAKAEAESYRLKLASLQNRDEELKEKAVNAAEIEKKKLLEEGRKEAEEIKLRWEEELQREKEAFAQKLRLFLAEKACEVSRNCLIDLADNELESLIWKKFLEKIELLAGEEHEKFRNAFTDNEQSPELHSVFEPSKDMQKRLEEKITAILPGIKKPSISYHNNSSLICGLELITGNYRLAWNVSDYLQGIDNDILKELENSRDTEKNREVS